MLDNKTKLELNKLFLELMEGSISDSRLAELDDCLRQSPEVQAYYCQFMHTQVSMNKVFGFLTSANSFAVFRGNDTKKDDLGDLEESVNSGSKVGTGSNVSLRGVDIEEFMASDDQADVDDSEKTRVMLELLELERTSPAVVIEKPEPVIPKRELIQKVDNNFKWFPGEGNKPLTLALLTMAACFMVFIGYLHLNPPPLPLPVVAYLDDSINAVWDDDLQMPDDYGEMVQSRYRLKKGYASILFNGGAKVTVEAPAELSLMGGGEMELFKGRIYAVVPERAQGFTVMVGDNKVVDLGTEFGVDVDKNNNTQLHVIKGKTELFTEFLTSKKPPIKVNEGAAKKIYSDGFVKDIDVASKHFVRNIRAPYMTLSVPNGSFETLVLNNDVGVGNKYVAPLSAPPWTTQWKAKATNIWKLDGSPNGGGITPNAAYGYGGIAAEGNNFGYLSAGPIYNHCLYQELAFSLQSLRTYDLSVKVGNPSPFNKGVAPAYRVELLAGGVVIASKSGTSPADDSKWITVSVSYTSGPDKAADPNVGQRLAIRLIADAFTEKKHLNFDDVQLVVKAGIGND